MYCVIIRGGMPKKLEKANILSRPIYKSIIPLLTIIPEGLKPREILVMLTDENILYDLKQKGKIKYDINKLQSEILAKLKRNDTYEYFKSIEKKLILTPQLLSNKINKLIDLQIAERHDVKIKLKKVIQSKCLKILYTENLGKINPSFRKLVDSQKIEVERKKIIDSFKKNLKEFSSEEQQILKQNFQHMKRTILNIKNILSSKIEEKWNDEVEKFKSTTKNIRIKKMIKDGGSVHLFQMINLPYYKIERSERQEFTIDHFYFYTGLLHLQGLIKHINNIIKTTRDFKELKSRKGRIIQIKKTLNKQVKSGFISKEEYFSKIKKVASEEESLYKEIKYKLDEIQKVKKIDEKHNKKLSKKIYLIPPRLDEEISHLEEIIFQDKKIPNFQDFLATWSDTFFWKDYGFIIEDLFEIVNWCWKKIHVIKKIYEDLDFIIKPTLKCEENIDEILISLGVEDSYKPFIFSEN